MHQADYSSRGVLPNVACLSVIAKSLDNEEALVHERLLCHGGRGETSS